MKVLITGGAGFIGSNAASRFLRRGDEAVILDNLSRKGCESNIEWLRPQGSLTFLKVDIRDAGEVRDAFSAHRDAALVLHLAGQVAVTQSLDDPDLDCRVNVLGTLNVLEAARAAKIPAPIIYSSTNKVYGQLDDLAIGAANGRCSFADLPCGVSEDRALDFHSPYGCSKGAADQYVRDYHRIFGLNTVVMRQSCIYGPRQFGVEDQGWVAWFMIAAACDRPVTIYGDGRQVRDILHVDNLIDAFEAAAANIGRVAGSVFNIGGGPENAVSLLEVLRFIEHRRGACVPLRKAAPRPGDQRVYVSDIGRAGRDLGWTPRTSWREGLDGLFEWVREHRQELS
jgi:CDP-paratose 2-epimerase